MLMQNEINKKANKTLEKVVIRKKVEAPMMIKDDNNEGRRFESSVVIAFRFFIFLFLSVVAVIVVVVVILVIVIAVVAVGWMLSLLLLRILFLVFVIDVVRKKVESRILSGARLTGMQ